MVPVFSNNLHEVGPGGAGVQQQPARGEAWWCRCSATTCTRWGLVVPVFSNNLHEVGLV